MCFKDTAKFKEIRLSQNSRGEKQASRMESDVRGKWWGSVCGRNSSWKRLMYAGMSMYCRLEGDSKERLVAFQENQKVNLNFPSNTRSLTFEAIVVEL